MSLLVLPLITITTFIIKSHSETLVCDETICDFGTCIGGTCYNNHYICTENSLTCKLQCNVSCNNVTITSSARHTEVICNKESSCDGLTISSPSPNNALYLECKKPGSCSNVNMECHADSICECQDTEDQIQCKINVEIDWIEYKQEPSESYKTAEPTTSNPTTYRISNPSIYSTKNPSINPTLNPTPNQMEKAVATQQDNNQIFAKQTTLKSNTNTTKNYDTLILIVISIVICWMLICILIPVFYIKIFKQNGTVKPTESDIKQLHKNNAAAIYQYNIPGINIPGFRKHRTSEGRIHPHLEMVNNGSMDDDDDDDDDIKRDIDNEIYEGVNGPTQGIEIGATPDGIIRVLTVPSLMNISSPKSANSSQSAMELDLPNSPFSSGSLDVTASLPAERIVASISNDDIDLLYAPGKLEKETVGNQYLD